MSRTAIQNARALLRSFLDGGCQDLFVRSGETEIFIARAGGRANPMLSPQPLASTGAATADRSIDAPHVATLCSILAEGSRISAGESLAVIQLLGESIDVVAPEDGAIGRHLAQPGDLLEFGTPIVTLRLAGD